MAKIRNVKLELLRPGPSHNQLLSPLTPYIALCGSEGPTTISIPFEHQQLLNRLERLRYVTQGKEISRQQCNTEVQELGGILGGILSQVPALISSMSSARCQENQLVHLRLATKAYEIALLPFELSIAKDGFPSPGSPLFLQTSEPIILTRETRGRHPTAVDWNRKPKILFAFASPGNLPAVPYREHLKALRRAIEPWVKYQKKAEDRVQEVKKLLTVLPNASLQDIINACNESQYTYIHILAHGDTLDNQGATDYGLALCDEKNTSIKKVIDGATLAYALTARDSLNKAKDRPTLVSLATCDSGNTGSTLVPGGSIAHALHAAGIPWIVASQFPLWMNASSIAVETLYNGLFNGEDPRWLLYNLRQRLRTECIDTHDWASIVSYASVPWDFEKQVQAFSNKQTRAKIEVLFDKALKISASIDWAKSKDITQQDVIQELKPIYLAIRNELTQWLNRLPENAYPNQRAVILGIKGASEKRIGNIYFRQGNNDRAWELYKDSCDFYKQALLTDPSNHWAITQYLSMRAVLVCKQENTEHLTEELGNWWITVKQIALWKNRKSTNEDYIWSLSTLAELELLSSVYCKEYKQSKAKKEIKRLCQELVNTTGPNTFPIFSTCRQFKRYRDYWATGDKPVQKEWRLLAMTAIKTLGDGNDPG